jgi:hypothetical protein
MELLLGPRLQIKLRTIRTDTDLGWGAIGVVNIHLTSKGCDGGLEISVAVVVKLLRVDSRVIRGKMIVRYNVYVVVPYQSSISSFGLREPSFYFTHCNIKKDYHQQ